MKHMVRYSETLEEMVVYQAMYGERGIWVRPKNIFDEAVERDGKSFRRFSPISDEEAEKIIKPLQGIYLCNGFLNNVSCLYPSWNFLDERVSLESVMAIDSDS